MGEAKYGLHHLQRHGARSAKYTSTKASKALANGIKMGSPVDELLKVYGKPEETSENAVGGKRYTYSTKGILFWTYQGKVIQIVIFRRQ